MDRVKDNLLAIAFGGVAVAFFVLGYRKPEWLAIGVAFTAVAALMWKKRDI